jgi:hypothetical protein
LVRYETTNSHPTSEPLSNRDKYITHRTTSQLTFDKSGISTKLRHTRCPTTLLTAPNRSVIVAAILKPNKQA